MNVNALLASGTVVMLACAGTAALVQDLGSDKQQTIQQLENQASVLENQASVCQAELKRVESEFRIYRDAIKDSRD